MKIENFELKDLQNLYSKPKNNNLWLEIMIKALKEDIESKGGIEKASEATKELLKKWEDKLKENEKKLSLTICG